MRLKRGHAPPPLWGGMKKFLVWHSKPMSKRGLNPKNHVSSSNGMAITETSIFKRWHASPLFLDFVSAYVQKGLTSRKSCFQLKWYGNIYFELIRIKRGHASIPLLLEGKRGGEVEKILCWHSKAILKMGLNHKNHVFSSNGMTPLHLFQKSSGILFQKRNQV